MSGILAAREALDIAPALDLCLPRLYDVNVEFDWDAGNVRHTARHSISPKEAEEAVLIEPLESHVQLHGREQRVLCFGRTKSGRLLTILYAERRGKIRVITAYQMTKSQQQMYFVGK